jgi:hypothetical protein
MEKNVIAEEVERIAEQLARKGFGPEWAARMAMAAKLAVALDDPETPPYALAAMSRELRALITTLPGGYYR